VVYFLDTCELIGSSPIIIAFETNIKGMEKKNYTVIATPAREFRISEERIMMLSINLLSLLFLSYEHFAKKFIWKN
jgi:hypothetical protein